MSEAFMKDPMLAFRRYLKYERRPTSFKKGFEAGVLAMAMELLTVVKTVNALPYEDTLAQQEVVATVYTLLVGLDLLEPSQEWYEKVNEARKVKFVEHGASLRGSASAEQLSLLPDLAPASSPAYPTPDDPAALDTPEARHYDQSPALPSAEQLEQRIAAVRAKRTERLLSRRRGAPPADSSG